MSRLTPTFLYLGGGLIVWFVRFIGVYAFTGLACARSWQDTTVLLGFGSDTRSAGRLALQSVSPSAWR